MRGPFKSIARTRHRHPHLARGDKLHHKFAVIDNKKVITGSFNWSPSAAHTNDETLLVIHSPELVAHFSREMDRLWDTAELGSHRISNANSIVNGSDVAMGWRGVEQVEKNSSENLDYVLLTVY